MAEAGKIRLSMHCTCGEYLTGEVNSAALADEVLQAFARRHHGKGHRPCYPANADRGRRAKNGEGSNREAR